MKWFKHYSDNSIQNEKLTRLLEDLKTEGYGRYYLLLECLIRGCEDLSSAPKAEFTINRWGSVLQLKPKTVKTFLEYLHNNSIIFLTYSDNTIKVELNNWSKLLSKSAISSQTRSTSGHPRIDKNIYNKIQLKNENCDPNIASNPAITTAANENPAAAAGLAKILKIKE